MVDEGVYPLVFPREEAVLLCDIHLPVVVYNVSLCIECVLEVGAYPEWGYLVHHRYSYSFVSGVIDAFLNS